MNKDVLLVLIEKDLKELETLTRGFGETDDIAPSILTLAREKVASLGVYFAQLSSEQPVKELHATTNDNPATIFPTMPEEDLEIAKEENRPETQEIIAAPEPAAEEAPAVAEATTSNAAHENEITETAEYTIAEKPVGAAEEKAVPAAPGSAKVSLAESLNAGNHSLNEVLAQQADESLADKLSNGKTDDLRKALSLAERFRFQRELFGGNGEKLNTTLSAINAMHTEEEALAYLSAFGWSDDDECKNDFLHLVHRKFV
jgi:hypothetical protein